VTSTVVKAALFRRGIASLWLAKKEPSFFSKKARYPLDSIVFIVFIVFIVVILD